MSDLQTNADRRDSRQVTRRKILKEGIIVFNGGHSTLPTTVRDWSDTGARLVYKALQPLPPKFRLVVPLDALQVNCEVVWHRQSLVGVRFVGEVQKTNRQRIQVVKPSDAPQAKGNTTSVMYWENW